MKRLFGIVFCVIAIAAALFGLRLAWFGASLVAGGTGAGTINVVAQGIGQVTGISGEAAVLLAGLVTLLTALALALKAIAEVKYEVAQAQTEGKEAPNRIWTAIKHFNPAL